MKESFAFADEFGPEKVVEMTDPRSGLRAILVVDNTAAGPAIGGCRMAPDVTAEECFRLARAMTFKNAAAGLPHGGGKLVLVGDPKMPAEQKETLIRSLARAIGEVTSYIPGPDMGTDETAMAWVRDEIGRSVGLPREVGGIPLDEIGATGFGLSAAMRAVRDVLDLPIEGARVAIQGYGAVGRWAAHHLAELGGVIVAVSDSRGGVLAPAGLDLARLDALKAEGKSVTDYDGATAMGPEEVLTCDCDIVVPAARPDVINEDNAGAIKARLVLEG
ncbi:MAG: Glu/Leu/Phe/Val family dehydrogenase, partial [Paracoccaceae bacterium]